RQIMRASDVPELRNQTARFMTANALAIESRRAVFVRYLQAYREVVDWMYADKAAVNAFEDWAHIPEAALEALYSDISAKSMFPFWATSTDVAHDEIKQLMGTQKAVPHRWSYKNDIEPILFRAAALVTMDDSERRSLILVNPGLSPRRATVSTMYTA